MNRELDPKLDLHFERIVDVPVEKVWAAWTRPEYIVKWFTPVPWKTIDAEVDLRPGGIFRTTMQSPEGEEFPNTGTYLEVVENRRLIWTSALLPGFRPQPAPEGMFHFTAIIEMEPVEGGTKYSATALHADPESAEKHAAMGFEQGWGTALTQLVEFMKSI